MCSADVGGVGAMYVLLYVCSADVGGMVVGGRGEGGGLSMYCCNSVQCRCGWGGGGAPCTAITKCSADVGGVVVGLHVLL